MATLRENLKDHPGQSILTALASVATIWSFIFLFRSESCRRKVEEKKDTFFAYGKILTQTDVPISNAKYSYILSSIGYSDNTDYNGNYRVQIDTNRSFVLKIFCKIGYDSVSALVKLTTSDTYPQNIIFPQNTSENKIKAGTQNPLNTTPNSEIVEKKKNTVIKINEPVFPPTPKIQLPTYTLEYNHGNEIPYSLTDTDNELVYGLLSYATTLTTVYIPSEKNYKRIRFSFIDPDKSNQPIIGWINIKYLKH
jgi:hypothetical protein